MKIFVPLFLSFMLNSLFASTVVAVSNVSIDNKRLSVTVNRIDDVMVRSELESGLISIPGIEIASRGNSNLSAIESELELQQSAKTSQNTDAALGMWAGARFLITPVISDINIKRHNIEYSNFTAHSVKVLVRVQINILNVQRNILIYSHVFTGKASSTSFSNQLLNTAIRNALRKVAEDTKIKSTLSSTKSSQHINVNVKFISPEESMVLVNGVYVGSGTFKVRKPLDSIINVQAFSHGYLPWKESLKVEKDKVINIHLVKKTVKKIIAVKKNKKQNTTKATPSKKEVAVINTNVVVMKSK